MSIASSLQLRGITRASTSPTPPTSPIVIDATALDTGHRKRGIGRYVAGLLTALDTLADPRHVCLRLATPAAKHDPNGDAFVAGSQSAPLAMPTWRLHRPPVGHRLRWGLNEAFLPGELTRAGVELYHATEPWALPIGRAFRTVVTCHDVIPLLFPEQYMNREHLYWRAYYGWLRGQERWKRSTRVLAISEATRQTVIEYLDVPEDRVDVVYNGIDHAQFKPVDDPDVLEATRRAHGLDRPFLLYLGGYDFRKNIAVVVEALRTLSPETEAELVLAGGMSNAERKGFEELAHQHGVANRLRFLGYIDDRDVAALYGLARAFVYPSLAEGFGLQALEAMALGCPVIAGNRSSLPEVIEDAGILVDPTDAEAIGDGIGRLLGDETLRKSLVERGFAQARKFSWERCARETNAVYGRALAEGAQP